MVEHREGERDGSRRCPGRGENAWAGGRVARNPETSCPIAAMDPAASAPAVGEYRWYPAELLGVVTRVAFRPGAAARPLPDGLIYVESRVLDRRSACPSRRCGC